jgi:serine/threonine protein kinase
MEARSLGSDFNPPRPSNLVTTSQPKRQPIPFGKYLLLDRINIGGMAEVWRGKMFGAGGFERLVAIKRILPNIAEDEEFITMFIDEAKISVQLNHANIAQIHELGQIANNYFIAMEYIPGKDMRAIFDRCRKKGEPAPIPLVAYCVSKMCEGLDYAHRKKDGMGRDLNIVHRDISPQNILISYEGEVKVIDFGIAKAAGKATKTQAGILKGKFGYMSPEQIRGLPLDRRSDVFAIGVCLYEMLTGERLFVGESDFSVLEKVRKAEVPPPSTYNKRIPENLEKIVLKALARDVDERYQYASELGDDLQRFLITSEAIFGRKDLMQYMKSTFAEEVEREKQRLAEYASIKPPDGMLSAIEAGFSGSAPVSAPAPAPAPVAPALAPVEPPRPAGPPMPNVPGAEGIRRTSSLTSLPKLTAATAAPPPKEDESASTMLVDSNEFFDDSDEPTTQPGVNVGRKVTPLESEKTELGLGEGEAPSTGKTAVIGPPPSVGAGDGAPAPARAALGNMPVVTPTPNVQVRPSVFGMPSVPGSEPGAPPTLRQGEGRTPGDGLPRIARPEGPGGRPPVLGAAGTPGNPVGAGTSRPGFGSAPVVASPPVVPPPPRPPPPRDEAAPSPEPGGSNRMMVFGGLGGLVIVVLGLLAFLLTRDPPKGFIMVQLPDELLEKPVQVKLNNQTFNPSNGVVLEKVEAGPVVVMVTAEGFKPFTEPVIIQEGTGVTTVKAALEPLKRTTSIVLDVQPGDAQVKVNGEVIRAQGARDMFIKDVPSGGELVVEVSAPGHKPFQQKYASPKGSEPLQVSAKLDPVEVAVRVESEPEGAAILASGKELGAVTPAVVKLPPGVKQVTLRLKCFQEAELPVNPPAPGESEALVKGSLKKQPGCK